MAPLARWTRGSSSRIRRNQYDATGAITCTRRHRDVTRSNGFGGPLCANMTSSAKPKVHDISQGHQRRSEPRPQVPTHTLPHIHTHPFNGPFSGTMQVSRYQKGKTNLDFTEARDSEWQWHQLGHMQVCTSLQTDSHATSQHPTTQSFYRPDALPAAQPTQPKH